MLNNVIKEVNLHNSMLNNVIKEVTLIIKRYVMLKDSK
jgi:hypothetical protein